MNNRHEAKMLLNQYINPITNQGYPIKRKLQVWDARNIDFFTFNHKD